MGLTDTTATRRDPGTGNRNRVTRLPLLTIVGHPDPARIGEQVLLETAPFPLDRATRVFPGGPLGDASVSREHARIEPDREGTYRLQDAGSRNGTCVNERRVGREWRRLADGDLVRVGEVLLLVHTVEVPPPEDAEIPSLLGSSQAIRCLRGQIARSAKGDLPVLILGETGSGKELVAAALHAQGRPGRPFRAVNAGALPGTLVESMLFGHLKGAFTDAGEARQGFLQACDRGTLFLDEIGEVPMDVQARLLRAVEERSVLPLGASRPIPIDVRLVAATNRELLQEVAAGRFREDLYARLAQGVIRCPPLRERREDIPVLALRFAGGRAFDAEAMTRLLMHPWPFNVRELKGVVEGAVAEGPRSGPLSLSPRQLQMLVEHRRYSLDRDSPPALDLESVEAALVQTEGNMSQAAARLGKDRGQLYRIVRRLGLDPGRFRKVRPDP